MNLFMGAFVVHRKHLRRSVQIFYRRPRSATCTQVVLHPTPSGLLPPMLPDLDTPRAATGSCSAPLLKLAIVRSVVDSPSASHTRGMPIQLPPVGWNIKLQAAAGTSTLPVSTTVQSKLRPQQLEPEAQQLSVA